MRSSLLDVALRSGQSGRRTSVRAILAGSGSLLPRVAAGLAVVVLVTAVFWGIGQHRTVQEMIVEAETDRYIAAFREEPVAPAWQRLSEVWPRELARQNALLDRLGGGPPTESFRHFQHFVLETVRENGMQREIAIVVGYFRRLALCVQIGNCDADAVRARFGDLPRRFLNQHFLYLSEAYPEQDLQPTFEALAPSDRLQAHAPAS